MKPVAILFDLDGTLVDSERESAEAMARALRQGQGIVVEQQDRDFIIGRSWVQIESHLRDRYPSLQWSRTQLIAETARRREEVFAESGVTILPGALSALRRFSHLSLGLVTGSSRSEARQSIRALGAESTFQAVIAAEDVPTSKPDPAGYRRAAELLGAPSGECLVVEDSAPGIAAGRAAGMRVVAVRAGNFAGHDQSAAHRIVETLEELDAAFVEAL